MDTDSTDSIIKKIKALLRLSKSDNQNEALLALEKANELMTKHQISLSETDLSSAQEVSVENYSVEEFKVRAGFLYRLFQACAQLFDCEEFNRSSLPGNRFGIIGNKIDIQLATGTFEYLLKAWNTFYKEDLELAKEERELEYGLNCWGPGDTLKFKSSHGMGFSCRVSDRVKELVASRKSQVSMTEKGRDLIIVKGDLVNKKMSEMGIRSRKQSVRVSNMGGFEAGVEAGDKVSLSQSKVLPLSDR